MFKIEFDTDNAAFVDGGAYEVARVLGEIAASVEGGAAGGHVRDINGNTVGTWEWSE